MTLLDTNLLGRLTDSTDPQRPTASRAVHQLFARGERLVIVPQVLYEFWAIATRRRGAPPAGQNGLGMTPERAGHWVRFLQRRFTLLHDLPDLVAHWQTLVETHRVTSFRAHDVRLVAAMRTHGIARLLTFNAADFRGLGVTVVDPASV